MFTHSHQKGRKSRNYLIASTMQSMIAVNPRTIENTTHTYGFARSANLADRVAELRPYTRNSEPRTYIVYYYPGEYSEGARIAGGFFV